MPFRLTLVFFLFSFPIVLEAKANQINNLIEQSLEKKLDTHPVWYKLLHYEASKKKSKVLTDSFFLSPRQNFSPKKELKETIKAYFIDNEKYINNKAQCSFPARYLWLSNFLELPNYQFRNPACEKLENWAKFDEVTSLSAVMVSGYFGNPASTFGHSLLKFNSENQQRFLDLTFNYGALVPEDEHILRYVFKGIFGGYQSGFSDGFFYSQDMVYSRTEFRDMWDYELELSEYERYLIMAHLWEISGKKFKYFFLTENCAYKIGEILDLVEKEKILTKNANLWYAPVELFNRIEKVDKSRSGYIKNIEFVPSFERKLNAEISVLTAKERIALDYWIKHHKFNEQALLKPEEKINVLNSLLAFYEFKQISTPKEADYKELKRKVLVARLALPVAKAASVEIEELPSPIASNPPMKFSLGAINVDGENFAAFSWSPFSASKTGFNSLQGGELKVFDLLLRAKEKTQLEQLDLISVRKMPGFGYGLIEGYDYGWNVKLSVARNLTDELEPIISAGLFDGVKMDRSLYLLGADIKLQKNEEGSVFAEPYFAWQYSQEKFKTSTSVGVSYIVEENKFINNHELSLDYFFSTRVSVGLQASYREFSKAFASINFYK